jgi:hypothetical protein
LAGALLFDEKIHLRIALFWFGLWDVGILHLQAVIQRTIVFSPAFLEHGSAEKIAVCAHTNRDPNKQEEERHFCIYKLRTSNSFQILKTKFKNQKSVADDVLFKAYPIAPL